MERVGVFYATREGHTARIAEHVASALRRVGIIVEVSNIRHAEPDLAGYSAVILAASVHAGTHEREMAAFVRRHIAQLGRVPAAFISVTLSQAGVEMPNATPEQRAQAAADVQRSWIVSIRIPAGGRSTSKLRQVLCYTASTTFSSGSS